ncbi:MAG: biotin--[acetyl-CoA-carboxylase] ligase [Thermodesulfobacteriota bacterium]
MEYDTGHILIPGLKNISYLPPDKDFAGLNPVQSDDWWVKVKKRNTPGDIYCVRDCSSTMDAVYDLCEKKVLKDYDSLITQFQSKGRGQFKKEWFSGSGNLMVSFKIPFVFKGKWSENLLPLILGNLICKALEHFGVEARIKWPNDILLKEKKIAGILVEKKEDYYIGGLGLNIVSAPDDFMLESFFSMPASSLSENRIIIDNPVMFWDLIFSEIYDFLNKKLANEAPSDLIISLNQKLLWVNEEVYFRNSRGEVEKFFLHGVSDDGGLILFGAAGKKVVYSGNIRPVDL